MGEERTLPSGAPVYGGRYAVEAELGHGGMGRVFRARDLKIGRAVALKLLAPGAHDEQQRLRFEQEARAAGALNHPNILAVHDVGEHKGEPYIVTELLEGETLRAMLARGPLPPDQALDLAAQLAAGLAAAHQKGIVHRDVKPENLFVTREGRLKILDFGIAKLLEPARREIRTETGAVMGTPGYMSPEQVRGQLADARSDVFAFGAVLHEMLSGRAPFDRGSRTETEYAILHETARPLSGPASGVASRCLEKDPAARYANAAEIVEDLHRGSTERPRRRAVFLIASLCALAAAVALGIRLRPSTKPAGVTSSIAVLPFVDMSPQKDQEYFSDGLSEELLNLLAKVPGLRVAARTSAFAFKGKNEDIGAIGQKLHVATILEGSVRKAGDRIRITTQLVNVSDGYHLWSEIYDRKLTDVFAVQDEIARAVVAALKPKLLEEQIPKSKDRQTSKPDAYAQYLLGRLFFNRGNEDGYHRAVQAFEKALALDPGFAPAWAGLSLAIYWETDSTAKTSSAIAEGQRRALAAAEKAAALGPDLGEVYAARGSLRSSIQWDWVGAGADFERALALSPENADVRRAYATNVLRPLGRLQEAIADLRAVTELDPLNIRAWSSLGSSLLFSGQLGPAREALNRSLEINPEQAIAPGWLAVTFLLDNQPAAALAASARSTAEFLRLAGAALAYHDMGKAKESQQELDLLITKHGHSAAYQIAQNFAWRGEKERAFEWLERAWSQRDGGLTLLKTDPFLRSLHGDPRYAALLAKMNLPAD